MHPDDVGVAELGEGPLLHVDLVVDVLVPPLETAHLGLLYHLEGERLAGAAVLRLGCSVPAARTTTKTTTTT